VVEVKKHALSFSNPRYLIVEHGEHPGGVFCVFNHHFFHQYGNLAVLGVPTRRNACLGWKKGRLMRSTHFSAYFEINSDYIHKYDVIRTLVF
jgi:hypothetical protein